jgi:GntR family transcriptional regulator/MocR family aminotransferase
VKRGPSGLAPIVVLDRRLAQPLHRQIYDGYRSAILDGRLRPGHRLPSTRALAIELRISRVPVVAAFEQLVAEGYVESRVGSGSCVSSALPLRTRSPREQGGAVAPAGPRRVPRERWPSADAPWLALSGAFRVSQPALDEFPAALWSRLVARRARSMPRRQMTYGDPMGHAPLREALAEYLATARSVRCTAEQIMIVSGSQQALGIASRALLVRGDAVWMEEPGYPGARDALMLNGARPVAVPVDAEGLRVDAGIARRKDARAAYVTPSHQYPLGMIMSAPRRLELLDWARRAGAWIFEDDYDSEYRYDTQPIAPLHDLDADRRVLYIGTFSKVLYPALRVGYLVVPDDLVARFRVIREAMDIFPPTLYQAALHDFLREGHFARHVRRMRAVYAKRRGVLVDAIARELGDAARVVGDHAGMHFVVLLSPKIRDDDIARRAAREGISVVPLSSCYVGARNARAQQGLILGYGPPRANEIVEAVRRLARLVR